MKVRVTLKDPDSMHDDVDRATSKLARPDGVTALEWQEICAERASQAKQAISGRWMRSGEYLTVEFDTDAMTATVIPR